MTDYLQAWQCVGCGRLDAPAPCVGICQDRKVELVAASEHEAVLRQLAQAIAQRDQMAEKLRWLASITPHAEGLGRTLRVFQQEARSMLASLGP